MSTQPRAIAMLTLLLATCETTLQTFKATDNPVDAELVQDLERMIERTRQELEALTQRAS
jgi:hypothetical protein